MQPNGVGLRCTPRGELASSTVLVLRVAECSSNPLLDDPYKGKYTMKINNTNIIYLNPTPLDAPCASGAATQPGWSPIFDDERGETMRAISTEIW